MMGVVCGDRELRSEVRLMGRSRIWGGELRGVGHTAW